MMGGKLELLSTPGEGSRFSFSIDLPQAEDIEPPEDRDWSTVIAIAEGQSVHALVVDDVRDNRGILERMLREIGVSVDTAADGLLALEFLGKHQPDIVFSDIRMPRMGGVELLERVISEQGDCRAKIVATTASVFDHQRQSFLDQGFDAFLNKPLQFGDVCSCLESILGVTFDHEDAKAPDLNDAPLVQPPQELLRSLHEALEAYSITEVRDCIRALRDLGDPYGPLVDRLDECSQNFDIDGIRDILDGLSE